jgi:hypothetical protein
MSGAGVLSPAADADARSAERRFKGTKLGADRRLTKGEPAGASFRPITRLR